MKNLMTLVLLSTVLIIHAQDNPGFQNLENVSIDTVYNGFFHYDPGSSRLINTSCRLLSKNDPFYCSDDIPFDGYIVAKYSNDNLRDSIIIFFNGGLSMDPEFLIYSGTNRIIGQFAANNLYINQWGTIYTSGHVNCMYNRKRKYQLQEDTIIEIVQPYNYVGLKGNTETDIVLYSDKAGSDILARLPANYEIEILLAEANTKDYDIDLFFLVRTKFGLVGWLRLMDHNDGVYGGILKDLFFAGD